MQTNQDYILSRDYLLSYQDSHRDARKFNDCMRRSFDGSSFKNLYSANTMSLSKNENEILKNNNVARSEDGCKPEVVRLAEARATKQQSVIPSCDTIVIQPLLLQTSSPPLTTTAFKQHNPHGYRDGNNLPIFNKELSTTNRNNDDHMTPLNHRYDSTVTQLADQRISSADQASDTRLSSHLVGDEQRLQLNYNNRFQAAMASISEQTTYPPAYCNIPGVVPAYRGRISGPPPAYADVIDPEANPPSYQSLYGQVREAQKNSKSLWQLTKRLIIIVMSTIGCTLMIGLIAFAPLAMIAMGSFYLDECKIEHLPAYLLMGGLVLLIKNVLQCYNHCEPSNDISGGEISVEDRQHRAFNYNNSNNYNNNRSIRRVPTFSLVEAELSRSSAAHRSIQPVVDESYPSSNQHTTSIDGQSSTDPCLIYLQPTTSLNNQRHDNIIIPIRSSTATEDCAIRLGVSSCGLLLNCILIGWFFAGCLMVFRSYEPNYYDRDSHKYCNQTLYLFTFYLILSIGLLFLALVALIIVLMLGSTWWNRRTLGDDEDSDI